MKRGTFSIVISDGEENKQWLKGTDLQEMPSAMLIDFVRFCVFHHLYIEIWISL